MGRDTYKIFRDSKVIPSVVISNTLADCTPLQLPEFCESGSVHIAATTNATVSLYGLLDGDPDGTYVPIFDQAGDAVTIAGITTIGIYPIPSPGQYRWIKLLGATGEVTGNTVYLRKSNP